MIQTVTQLSMPVDETLSIRRNRLQPEGGGNGRRISIVTGIHGDELEGQYVCYEVARRIALHPEHLAGTVDIDPALNPFGLDSITRGIPAFDLDMNRVFPRRHDGDMNESLVAEMGVGMRVTRAYGNQLTEGIFHLVARLGVWDGPVAPVREPSPAAPTA